MEVCLQISDGTHFTPNYIEEGIPFISVKDVRPYRIDFSNTKYISKKEAKILDKRCKPQFNDILLTKIGATFGFASIVNTYDIFQIFVSLALLRPDINKINPEFLEIFLNTRLSYLQFARIIKGAGVPDLHLEDIRKSQIVLPDIVEQNKIVKFFKEQLNKKRSIDKEANDILNNIEDYLLLELGIITPIESDNTLDYRIFNTDFSDTLGNRLDPFYHQKYFEAIDEAILNSKYKESVTKLRNCLSFIESGSRPSGGVKNIEEGVLSFGGEHVNWLGKIEVKTPKYIPLKYHKNHRLTHTKMNDVLIVKDGATTGKIGIIINPEHVDQNINEHVFLLRFTNLNPFFATYLLNTSLFQKAIKRQITGATVTGLTKQALKSILIPVPDMDTQNSLVEIISQKRQKAFSLMEEAEKEFEKAKQEVEKMILE